MHWYFIDQKDPLRKRGEWSSLLASRRPLRNGTPVGNGRIVIGPVDRDTMRFLELMDSLGPLLLNDVLMGLPYQSRAQLRDRLRAPRRFIEKLLEEAFKSGYSFGWRSRFDYERADKRRFQKLSKALKRTPRVRRRQHAA